MGVYSSGTYVVVGGSAYQTYPVVGTGSTGYVALAVGANPNYWGAWTEITSSTAAEIAIVGLNVQNGGSNQAVQLGTGAASSETEIGTVYFGYTYSANNVYSTIMLPYPIIVSAGTRLAARGTNNLPSATNVTVIYVLASDLRLR